MLSFGNNGSNSAQESSPNEESNDSSDDISAHTPNTSGVSCLYDSRDSFEQGHVIARILSTQQTQNIHN